MLAESEEKQLIRAQRLAKRTRASAACLPCKAKKIKCSDYRPCARCRTSPDICIDENADITRNMFPGNIAQENSASVYSVAISSRREHVASASDGSKIGLSEPLNASARTYFNSDIEVFQEGTLGTFTTNRRLQVSIRMACTLILIKNLRVVIAFIFEI
jgi:hypothetical protein